MVSDFTGLSELTALQIHGGATGGQDECLDWAGITSLSALTRLKKLSVLSAAAPQSAIDVAGQLPALEVLQMRFGTPVLQFQQVCSCYPLLAELVLALLFEEVDRVLCTEMLPCHYVPDLEVPRQQIKVRAQLAICTDGV